MDLKFVQNFQQGVVEVLIYEEIGRNPETGKGISGEMLASELAWLDANGDVETIRLRINSPGGNLLSAISVFNAIRNCTKPTETYIDGVAASSAGLIAMAGKKRFMNDFARLMIHAPSVPDSTTIDDKTKTMLANFEAMIVELLVANSKCDEKKVRGYVAAETWLTAKEALSLGFVDSIVDTGREIEQIMNELAAKAPALSAAEVYNTINNFLIHTPQMSKINEVKAKLGLEVAATEDQILSAVNNLSASNAELKARLTEAENKLTAANETAAAAFVDNAIKAGKFPVEKREALVAQAKNNLDAFKETVEAMVTPSANITNRLSPDGNETTGKVVDGRFNGKTFREWEKADPSVLKNLLSSDKKAHGELFFAQYGTEFKES